MENKLISNSCERFTSRLSSSDAVPGGGGAAALAGALGASLCAMAANLTAGKKKYAEHEEKIQRVIKEADALRLSFLELVDLDAQAFLPLSKAYGIDKNDPERGETIRRASLDACVPAGKMLEHCGKTTELLQQMFSIGNPMLISDVGCGAELCLAAMNCAAMNVYVNTRDLKGDEEAEKLNMIVKNCLEKYAPAAEKLVRDVMKKLEG